MSFVFVGRSDRVGFSMSSFLRTIFVPHDDSRRAVEEYVATAHEKTDQSINRLEATITELMGRNDQITRRKGSNHAGRI